MRTLTGSVCSTTIVLQNLPYSPFNLKMNTSITVLILLSELALHMLA
jgi:hypothetical protein